MSIGLLIIDVQKDYFEGGRMELVGSKEASEKIKSVLARFRERGEPVLHIQHISRSKSATFFLPDTDGIEFHENVRPLKDEIVFQKHFPNSFRETGLDEYCKERGIVTLIIVGMMTHMCIDTTTRAAYDLGYKCVLLEDCCATKDLEFKGEKAKAKDVQISFMAAIDGTFAEVMSSGEYLACGEK